MRQRGPKEFYINDNEDGTYTVGDSDGNEYDDIFTSEESAQHWIENYDDGYEDYIYDQWKDGYYEK